LGIPASPGVPAEFTRLTLTAPYNDLKTVQRLIQAHHRELACVIVEPVAGNMGVVLPGDDFLPALRELTRAHGIVLVFDEVITGFRVRYGGAQTLYEVTPDLTCLGKIIGGGLPVGAYGGSREIMNWVAPAGPVYQAGTLSGNPLAVAAGIETLKRLKAPRVYHQLEARGAALAEGIGASAKKAGVSLWQTRVGSMLGVFFTTGPVVDYESAARADTQAYAKFFHRMLEKGIYFAPSQFEAVFLSKAHSAGDIEQTIMAARAVFRSL
jgi:glutamate-1-semialdehyde 2,1-aminomutase